VKSPVSHRFFSLLKNNSSQPSALFSQKSQEEEKIRHFSAYLTEVFWKDFFFQNERYDFILCLIQESINENAL